MGRLREGMHRFRGWVEAHVPPGLRLPLGLVLIVAGIFGFLPVLGFWMIPLGLTVAAIDVGLLLRYLRRHRRDEDG